MVGFRDTLATVTGWLKDIVELGLGVALIFLVIDVLFGPTTGIVQNLSALIRSFTESGLVGLIALIIFVAIYSK